jgi:hypothetical protein
MFFCIQFIIFVPLLYQIEHIYGAVQAQNLLSCDLQQNRLPMQHYELACNRGFSLQPGAKKRTGPLSALPFLFLLCNNSKKSVVPLFREEVRPDNQSANSSLSDRRNSLPSGNMVCCSLAPELF